MKKIKLLNYTVLLVVLFLISGCYSCSSKKDRDVVSVEVETVEETTMFGQSENTQTESGFETEQETMYSEPETDGRNQYTSIDQYETVVYNGKNYSSAWNGSGWSLRERCEEIPDDDFKDILEQLKKDFPDGMYWNKGSVSNEACSHPSGRMCNKYEGATNIAFSHYRWYELGTQCLGFASLISDCIFGADAPVHSFSDFKQVRVGDHVRMNNDTHSAIVIEKGTDYILVVECNADYKTCQITWGRKITEATLNATNSWYVTRYF